MRNISRNLRNLGPGLLVTAAFIGPGTIATASKAGAGFGFALLWALVFASVATIVLQEMAARLGLVTRQGLGEAVRSSFRQPILRACVCGLIVVAIGFGNAAYQTGNITGARLGLDALVGRSFAVAIGGITIQLWPLVIGLMAFGLLWSGAYKVIERAMIGLVLVMSVVFILTAFAVQPSLPEIARGMFVPTIPTGSLLTIVALIGTTVVPYNLFLHASAVQEKWTSDIPVDQSIREARLDLTLAVALGGLITLAVVATAAAAFFDKADAGFSDAGDLARQLEPLLGGPAAKWFFGLGLLAAGLTSAITAPLAAAFAVSGALGWCRDLKSWRFRIVWMLVLTLGALLAAVVPSSPTQVIMIAQVANGLILPLIAVFLLAAVNRTETMKGQKNGWKGNLAGGVVVLIAAMLGLKSILDAI